MIELRAVDFAYDDSDHTGPILDRVDLRIEEGELVVVAGRTGAGKSTLLGVLAGLVPRYSGGTLRGDVVLDGRSILQAPPRERAHLVGYVAQDPASGFVTDTVEEELAYGMEQLGVAPGTMRRRVEETLDLLGVADLRARDLRSLSGGEQQRVAIGSVLTMHPQLLVLDEPTSALDPTAAEDVLATLARLVDDLGLSVLVAEHRLERVLPFADRVAVLDGGRLRVGPPPQVLADAPVAPPIVELGRLLGWHPLPMSVREARRAARILSLHPVAPPAVVPGPVVVQARALSVTRGRTVVLREVDLDVTAGSVTAVMGRNGSGKSTLLWSLQGGLARTTGRVALGADDPASLSAAERRGRIGLVPQTADDLLYLETVREECTAADQGAGAASGTCRETLDTLVPGIDDDTHPRDLSQGQRLALVLAVVLSTRPSLVLLDEPTRGLDYAAKEHLAAILHGLAADGRGVLVATHDVEFVARVADRVVVLADGEVVSSGPVREVVLESPSFAPQVTKILGAPWLRVDEVTRAVELSGQGVAP